MHSEKVGAFRANGTELIKLKKGGFTAAHIRTALIWEYTLRKKEQGSAQRCHLVV